MWALGYEGDQIEPWQLIEEVNGRRTPTLVQSAAAVPEPLRLLHPIPIPLTPASRCAISVPGPGRLQIDLYDVLGRRIHAWSQRAESTGFSQWRWNGRNLTGQETASGLYTMHFQYQADDGSLYSQSRRVVPAAATGCGIRRSNYLLGDDVWKPIPYPLRPSLLLSE